MTLIIVVGLAVVLGAVAAVLVFAVLYRAMSNLVDGLILTFGNEEAAARIRADRLGPQPDDDP